MAYFPDVKKLTVVLCYNFAGKKQWLRLAEIVNSLQNNLSDSGQRYKLNSAHTQTVDTECLKEKMVQLSRKKTKPIPPTNTSPKNLPQTNKTNNLKNKPNQNAG